MHLVAIAWIYVVLMMAAAEAASSNGTWLGAFFTLTLYGVLPLALALYLLRTPARRAQRQAADAAAAASASVSAPPVDPDRGPHAPGNAVATERKEP